SSLLFFLTTPPPPTSTLFPYTTLFRSRTRARRSSPGGVARPAVHNRVLQSARPSSRRQGRVRRGACRLCDRASAGRHQCDRPCRDRKSTRLNSSHVAISYAVFCLKKKK